MVLGDEFLLARISHGSSNERVTCRTYVCTTFGLFLRDFGLVLRWST
jgi:hypothetical protein